MTTTAKGNKYRRIVVAVADMNTHIGIDPNDPADVIEKIQRLGGRVIVQIKVFVSEPALLEAWRSAVARGVTRLSFEEFKKQVQPEDEA